MIGEKEQRKQEMAVDKEKTGWVREPGSIHLVKEQRHPSDRICLSKWVTQASTSPVSADTRIQPVGNQFPLSPFAGKAGSQTRPGEPSDLIVSKPREETERRLAENIMKGGLGKAIKKSLGQRGKERSLPKRSMIGSVFTFYHAQWARSSHGRPASVHLGGDGCQEYSGWRPWSVTFPEARGSGLLPEWPPRPPPHWISSETESQRSNWKVRA